MTSPPFLRVRAEDLPGVPRDYRFQTSFRIGRADDCEVAIKNDYVSRVHVEVTFENGQWWARDLNSSNGLFVNGVRVDRAPVGRANIRLGIEGPVVTFEVEQPPAPPPAAKGALSESAVAHYMDHYFGQSDAPVGEHTMIVRQAFSRVQTRQKRKYGSVIAGVAGLALVIALYAFYEHREAGKQKALAESIFYSMKSLDVDIAGVETLVLESNSRRGSEEIRKLQSRRREMATNYDQFLNALNVYSAKITPQEKLILRIARVFGECEVAMPPGFVQEVNSYIQKWRSSDRLRNAIHVAQQNGYTKTITADLLAADLPPQFFYLALQESNFDAYTSGPKTRKGYAKGMWQFIPETAAKYGLHVGPLADLPRRDPGDDRHHYELETKAAARYIRDLYSTDAQASGLLVMSCYNWGEDSVLPLIRKMPANPKDRNFWKLLALYRDKIPKETYEYVFYIFSAAVIGENPKLFGFDFDNPLDATGAGVKAR